MHHLRQADAERRVRLRAVLTVPHDDQVGVEVGRQERRTRTNPSVIFRSSSRSMCSSSIAPSRPSWRTGSPSRPRRCVEACRGACRTCPATSIRVARRRARTDVHHLQGRPHVVGERVVQQCLRHGRMLVRPRDISRGRPPAKPGAALEVHDGSHPGPLEERSRRRDRASPRGAVDEERPARRQRTHLLRQVEEGNRERPRTVPRSSSSGSRTSSG